jgi:lia operon protein LiaG
MKKLFALIIVLLGTFLILQQTNILAWPPNTDGGQQAKITNQIQTIDIELSGASATIIPDQGSNLRTELKGKGKISVDKKGDTLEVTYKRNWFEGLGFFSNTKITIYIPEEYNHNMKLDIGSGNVKTSGYSTRKPLKLDEFIVDVGSGNVTFEHLTANTFKQDVSSGNVQINHLEASNTFLDISSGNINIEHFSGGIESDISSGNLDLQVDKLDGDIKVDISSGKASLDLPKNASFKLQGKVSSGSIKNSLPLADYEENQKYIKGKHGNGKYNIQLDVSSGIIELY